MDLSPRMGVIFRSATRNRHRMHCAAAALRGRYDQSDSYTKSWRRPEWCGAALRPLLSLCLRRLCGAAMAAPGAEGAEGAEAADKAAADEARLRGFLWDSVLKRSPMAF